MLFVSAQIDDDAGDQISNDVSEGIIATQLIVKSQEYQYRHRDEE